VKKRLVLIGLEGFKQDLVFLWRDHLAPSVGDDGKVLKDIFEED